MPFPTLAVLLNDGTERRLSSRQTLLQDWGGLPDRRVMALRLLPEERVQFTGEDRFWVYSEDTTFVVGGRRPALDVGTVNAVPVRHTEVVLTASGVISAVREPLDVPVSAVVKESSR